ncbi:hypothetical protein ACFQS6_15345 [Xanthomonas populi]
MRASEVLQRCLADAGERMHALSEPVVLKAVEACWLAGMASEHSGHAAWLAPCKTKRKRYSTLRIGREVNRPGFPEAPWFESRRHDGLRGVRIVVGLSLGRRDISDRLVDWTRAQRPWWCLARQSRTASGQSAARPSEQPSTYRYGNGGDAACGPGAATESAADPKAVPVCVVSR